MPARRVVRFWGLDHHDAGASGVSPPGAAVIDQEIIPTAWGTPVPVWSDYADPVTSSCQR